MSSNNLYEKHTVTVSALCLVVTGTVIIFREDDLSGSFRWAVSFSSDRFWLCADQIRIPFRSPGTVPVLG
jgi:hypothetical protein